jgi:CRP/FNR family transcriptional regulator, cyclic AMP receptor protein
MSEHYDAGAPTRAPNEITRRFKCKAERTVMKLAHAQTALLARSALSSGNLSHFTKKLTCNLFSWSTILGNRALTGPKNRCFKKVFDLDQDEGMRILTSRGWLSTTPVEFQRAILSNCRWQRLEAGVSIQEGGEEIGELIGLAQGIVEMRTILGPDDTPIMHFAHPVVWFGYIPIIFGTPRRINGAAKTPVWLARIPHAAVMAELTKRPEWWRHFLQPALYYGDVAVNIAADLLIRDSERRCAAVLLRLCGRRFAGPDDSHPCEAPVTQDELAGAANLSRNSVGAMLKRMAARGLIRLGYRGVIILAPPALRAFVETGQ